MRRNRGIVFSIFLKFYLLLCSYILTKIDWKKVYYQYSKGLVENDKINK